MTKSISGIYKITNNNNGRFYIGSSTNLNRRKGEHFRELKRNAHRNSYFQRAYNKEPVAFEFKIICLCDEQLLLFYEQRFLDFYPDTYNVSKSALVMNRGRKHSEETKRKISSSLRGLMATPIFQLDVSGNLIKEFFSIREAANLLNLDPSNISKACRGKRGVVGGYRWSYSLKSSGDSL